MNEIKKGKNLKIHPDLHREIKIRATKDNLTVSKYIDNLLSTILKVKINN